jgi:predicted oxidoreductase
MADYQAEIVIAGGGLAGLATAYRLLDAGKRVLLLEKDTSENLGGLAKLSFGGLMMVGTPHQRRRRIADSPELALRDWESFAEFSPEDSLPREWAKFYCENSIELIYEFLDARGVEFLPVVNWAERGLFKPGNSVPRWHITWGTGHEIIARMIAGLESHPRRDLLDLRYEHGVSDLELAGGRVVGVRGKRMTDGAEFTARGERVVIASGGICGGDLKMVKANWYKGWGQPPKHLLNGAHRYGDGLLHERAEAHGAVLTHLDKHWHYAAGIHHPKPRFPGDGISLVPPRSALWLNARGERIGPVPLMGYTDTRFLVEEILRQPGQYSWQVMNWKIALKELAVSGCDYMTAFRYKKKLMLLKHLLLGNRELVERLVRECGDDVVTASTIEELAGKMNERSLEGQRVDARALATTVRDYDDQISRAPKYISDDQIRRIQAFRSYGGDRLRVCKFQRIIDQRAMPLVAIREFILTRKSLGGIRTDIRSRVLRANEEPIPGLYAVGEAAGFGGGGIHGLRSLEGTFLGGCVLTAQVAARAIQEGL